MTSTIMRQLERELSRQYPELVCELRERYHDWNTRTCKDVDHWHQEVRNINSFLNWMLIDEFNQIPQRKQTAPLRRAVVRARTSLGTLNNVTHVDGWISNLMDRYFSIYAEIVT